MLVVYLQQRNFIFFPTQVIHKLSQKNSRNYSLQNMGVTLRGWLLRENKAHEKIILYYGGNAEDIFLSINEFDNFEEYSVLLVNYRGYGNSDGLPGEAEFFSDALAVYDDISVRFSPKQIILMGRSLGSGVASYVAGKRNISGLILITPFDSLESLARRQFPFLPTSLLLRHPFRSIDHIGQYIGPCLVLYGGRDNTVPEKSTLELVKHIKGKEKIVRINDADHNNIQDFKEYVLAIQDFLP